MSSTSTTVDPGYAAQDISWVALLIVILVLSLTSVIVGARIYTRIFLVKSLGWDDYCVVVTLVRLRFLGTSPPAERPLADRKAYSCTLSSWPLPMEVLY